MRTNPSGIVPDGRSTIDEIRRLQADLRAHWDGRRMFFLEGVRNVVHAIESGFRIETLIYSEKLLIVPNARRLVRDQCRSGTPTLHVSPEDFRQVSTTPRASGVGAIVAQRWSPLHRASPEIWALLGLTRGDPLRGESRETDPDLGGHRRCRVHPGRSQSTPLHPGSSVPRWGLCSCRPSSGRTTEASGTGCRTHRCRVIGASPDGSADLHRFDYPRPTILVLGEERQGLSPAQRGLCTDLVRIPMVGTADSLNFAVAGSLLLYEVYRARAARRGGLP